MYTESYGLAKRINISLDILDKKEMMMVLFDPRYKYSQAKITPTKVTYFRQGFKLYSKSQYVKKFNKVSNYMPQADFILAISVNKQLIPNDHNIVRVNGGTMLLFPVLVQSIRHLTDFYTDVGLGFNPEPLIPENMTYTLRTNELVITGKYEQELKFAMTNADIIASINTQFPKLIAPLKDFVHSCGVHKIYLDPAISKAYMDQLFSFFNGTLLFNDFAARAKEQLTNMLNAKDFVQAYASTSYVIDGVPFLDEAQYHRDVRYYGSHEKALLERKLDLRVEFLISHCNFEQRLEELTHEEAHNSRPYTLTDQENDYINQHPEDEEYKERLYSLGLERWKTAQERKQERKQETKHDA